MIVRRILAVLFALVIIGSLIGGYVYLRSANQPTANVYQAIPQDAIALLRGSQPLATWRQLAHSTIMWEELRQVESITDLHDRLGDLDSALSHHPDLLIIAESEPLMLSFHPQEEGSFTFLLTSSLPGTYSMSDVEPFLQEWAGQEPTTEKIGSSTAFRNELNSQPFWYAFEQQILLLSPSQKLLAKALAELETQQGVWADASFQEALETAGTTQTGNLYVHWPSLPQLITPLMHEETAQALEQRAFSFAGWSSLDIDLKSNEVVLSGFQTYADSLNHFISLWEDQKPQDHHLVRVLPENCAAFVHGGTSNFTTWYERYLEWLENRNELLAYDKQVAQLEDSIGVSCTTTFLDWVEHEIAWGYLEPRTQQGSYEPFAVLKAANIELAQERIGLLATKQMARLEQDTVSQFQGYPIYYLGLPSLFPTLFSEAFEKHEARYCTFLDRYVIFTATEDAAKTFINHYVAERTLDKNPGFQILTENIAEESNLFVYANVARAANWLIDHIAPEQGADAHVDLFRQFQAFTIQWSYEREGLFYQHVYGLHNPIYKEKANTLWELALEAPLRSKPVLVRNHYTDAREVVVQDKLHNLYLISNSGKVLWKRKLDGPILGEVHQIDAYRNGKLQLLFNTRTQLYLIDRKGRNTGSFPVKPESAIAQPLTLLDYTDSRNYRILVPLENGQVRNFENLGEPVNGWRFKALANPLAHPVVYGVVRGKDYLLMIDREGFVSGYDRRGLQRLRTSQNRFRASESVTIRSNHSLESSYLIGTDSTGAILRFFLDDRTEREDLGFFAPEHTTCFADVTQDGTPDYIVSDTGRIVAFDKDQSIVFEAHLPGGTYTPCHAYSFAQNTWIGIANTGTEELFLVDRNGNLHPEFPLKGSSAFTITDLNRDGSLNLLVSDQSGLLYCYILTE